VAEATERTLFTPANTQAALGRVLDARARILAPESQLASRSARVLGALAGNVAAPALSTNAVMARTLAAQLREQGASDEAVTQQLGMTYTPEVVRFVVAATPQRMPQQ
jgi:hypothetical protein